MRVRAGSSRGCFITERIIAAIDSQFDRDWRALSSDPIAVDAPECLAEMLGSAEAMAGNEAFVRVDFYCEGGALKFGEYCLYPGSGLDPFTPDALDLELGAMWSRAA